MLCAARQSESRVDTRGHSSCAVWALEGSDLHRDHR